MAMDGSDSHGDADTLPQYFGPDFKEYVLKEQLKWSLYKQNLAEFSRNFSRITFDQWVFWSEQDHEIKPSLSLDNFADFNLNVCAIPKVRDNIRRALQKLMQPHPWYYGSLVQFWAATKTLEGRTLLTTRYEPFALGGAFDTRDRVPLCNYRMGMCREYNFFYADAESGEEQLGLPGRVFLHQFPEYIPKVEYYTTKEYPQRDLALPSLALHGDIWGSWAVPVFEHSSQICVGVLEMVSLSNLPPIWHHEFFPPSICDVFQEFGLQCFGGYEICEMRSRGNGITNFMTYNRRTRVFQELKTVMRLVLEKHGLPLAMAWVPCSACNGLETVGVEYCARIDGIDLAEFSTVSKCSHLRKGWVASRALSLQSPDMLYFPSITKLSVDEYPLVPYARMCKFSGWFIMCLRSNYTGDDIYVLEFFWSTNSEDYENIQTRLKKLLGTMEDKLGNFRFASALKLGYSSSVDVIDVENNQKISKRYEIQATRTFSSQDSDPSTEQSSASVSNVYKIQATRTFSSQDSDPSTEQSSASVSNLRPWR